MSEVTKFIGLDVHKETIAVAFAEGERGGEVRYLGPVVTRMMQSGDWLSGWRRQA